MTKNDLAREVAVSEKLLLSTSVKAVDGILRVIKETLAKGEDVIIRGFGKFSVIQREERTALNPTTKEPVVIPTHRAVKLTLSKELKELLNNGTVD